MGRLDPVDALHQAHEKMENLCDLLEEIADGLPDNVEQDALRDACARLRNDLPLHHRDEEDGLFPLLLGRMNEDHVFFDVFGDLSREHAFDEGYAEEITVTLELLSHDRGAPNSETLGYMLRGFFEGYRRHIRWEKTVLLPLARQLLDQSDLRELTRRMTAHRRH